MDTIVSDISSPLKQLLMQLFEEKGCTDSNMEVINFFEDLMLDSMDFMSLVLEVESVFNVEIPIDKLSMQHFNRIEDMVNIIEVAQKVTLIKG